MGWLSLKLTFLVEGLYIKYKYIFPSKFEVFVLQYQKLNYNQLDVAERNKFQEKSLGISKIFVPFRKHWQKEHGGLPIHLSSSSELLF